MRETPLHDTSTMKAEALRGLPVRLGYDSVSGMKVDDSMGSGCFLDPPGFPSYFLQHVYTRMGNDPGGRPHFVIQFEGAYRMLPEEHPLGETLRDLWKPLPLEHPRTQAWTREVLRHLAHCYHDEKDIQGIGIYPVPSYKRELAIRRYGASEEEWEQEQARVDAKNAEIEAYFRGLATIDNHNGVRMIREFYPEFTISEEALAESATVKEATSWWETMSRQPTPEECPGEYRWSPITGRGTHPVGGNWCQVCGWREPAEQSGKEG